MHTLVLWPIWRNERPSRCRGTHRPTRRSSPRGAQNGRPNCRPTTRQESRTERRARWLSCERLVTLMIRRGRHTFISHRGRRADAGRSSLRGGTKEASTTRQPAHGRVSKKHAGCLNHIDSLPGKSHGNGNRQPSGSMRAAITNRSGIRLAGAGTWPASRSREVIYSTLCASLGHWQRPKN